jgi:hypothetical protein
MDFRGVLPKTLKETHWDVEGDVPATSRNREHPAEREVSAGEARRVARSQGVAVRGNMERPGKAREAAGDG